MYSFPYMVTSSMNQKFKDIKNKSSLLEIIFNTAKKKSLHILPRESRIHFLYFLALFLWNFFPHNGILMLNIKTMIYIHVKCLH